jgi:hypothetical protein
MANTEPIGVGNIWLVAPRAFKLNVTSLLNISEIVAVRGGDVAGKTQERIGEQVC